MTDNPVSDLVGKYVDNDNVSDAIEEAERLMFEELKKWDDGTPSFVMMSANLAATEAQIKFQVHMSIDALAAIHGWDDEVAGEQELLAYAALRLIREDRMFEVVKMMRSTYGTGST